MHRKRLFFLAVLAAFWLGTPFPSPLAQIQGSEAVLSGLTTLHPVIRFAEDGTLRPGSRTARRLQSDAERMLADAGIQLVDSTEFNRLLGARSYPVAMLELDVRMFGHPDSDLKSYLLSLRIRQSVFLARKPVVRFLGLTWESMDFGVAGDAAFVTGVGRDAVGRLIQDWRDQNAK